MTDARNNCLNKLNHDWMPSVVKPFPLGNQWETQDKAG